MVVTRLRLRLVVVDCCCRLFRLVWLPLRCLVTFVGCTTCRTLGCGCTHTVTFTFHVPHVVLIYVCWLLDVCPSSLRLRFVPRYVITRLRSLVTHGYVVTLPRLLPVCYLTRCCLDYGYRLPVGYVLVTLLRLPTLRSHYDTHVCRCGCVYAFYRLRLPTLPFTGCYLPRYVCVVVVTVVVRLPATVTLLRCLLLFTLLPFTFTFIAPCARSYTFGSFVTFVCVDAHLFYTVTFTVGYLPTRSVVYGFVAYVYICRFTRLHTFCLIYVRLHTALRFGLHAVGLPHGYITFVCCHVLRLFPLPRTHVTFTLLVLPVVVAGYGCYAVGCPVVAFGLRTFAVVALPVVSLFVGCYVCWLPVAVAVHVPHGWVAFCTGYGCYALVTTLCWLVTPTLTLPVCYVTFVTRVRLPIRWIYTFGCYCYALRLHIYVTFTFTFGCGYLRLPFVVDLDLPLHVTGLTRIYVYTTFTLHLLLHVPVTLLRCRLRSRTFAVCDFGLRLRCRLVVYVYVLLHLLVTVYVYTVTLVVHYGCYVWLHICYTYHGYVCSLPLRLRYYTFYVCIYHGYGYWLFGRYFVLPTLRWIAVCVIFTLTFGCCRVVVARLVTLRYVDYVVG